MSVGNGGRVRYRNREILGGIERERDIAIVITSTIVLPGSS